MLGTILLGLALALSLLAMLLMLAAARNDAAPGEGVEAVLRVLPPAWPAWTCTSRPAARPH